VAQAEGEARAEAAAVTPPLRDAGAPHVRLERNPALVGHARERAQSVQNRIADRITAFAGSMSFVYIHIAWFGCWIGFGVERYPYGLLTMIVSLEAIFLSTFVMISQNRADAKRQALADQQWQTVKEEDRQNEELLALSRQILELTKAIHGAAAPSKAGVAAEARPRGTGLASLSVSVGRSQRKEMR
jgi:uncharacterized membrane protein